MRIPSPGIRLRRFLQHGFHFVAISLDQHVTQLIQEFDQRVRVLRSKVRDDGIYAHGVARLASVALSPKLPPYDF